MKSPVILSFIFLVCTHTQAGIMTKIEAYELLKSQGFKWNMTETLGSDAEAKTQEAQSEFKPRVGLGFRQYVARINPIQYGSTAAQTIDTVGFGTTAIEMSWTLMDSLAKAKLLSAQANEKMSATQTKHFQNELTALMLIQYLNVQRLKQQLDVMDANINKSNLIFKLATARRSVGAGIQLDVARSKNLLKLDQLKKIAIYTKYMKAKHELALSLSIDKLDSDLEVLKPVLLPNRDYKSSLSKTLDSRPDLKTAELGLQAAADLHSETHRFIFPKLQLLAELGTTQPTLFGMPPTTLNGILGVSLSIPLFTGVVNRP